MFLEQYKLSGRTAVVTGAGQGIGFSCAQALGEAGARVVVTDKLADRVESAVAKLKALKVDASGAVLDVTDSAAIEELATKLDRDQAGVGILVNNAGFCVSNTKAEETSDEHWRSHLAVMLDGVFYCSRSFGKRMLARGKGAIVNMGSMSAVIVNKPQEQCFYNAAKAGVHQLTKSLACEWARRGVRVNAVAPTYIATPLTTFGMQNKEMAATWLEMTPMGRVGQPEEIASVVLFLASDASSLLTGSIVMADAGYTCW
jgi:NAD(P)-dependent dehydrogenase (short-subunit alcohol dehydrogenase family)